MISGETSHNHRTRRGISAVVTAIAVVSMISASVVIIVEIQTSSNPGVTMAKSLVETSTSTNSQQSLSSNLTQSGGGQLALDHLALYNYSYQSIGSGVAMTIGDVGSTAFTISTVYFDGGAPSSITSGCATGSAPISPSGTCSFTLVPTFIPVAGTPHIVKIVTSNGGTSVFSVVAGMSDSMKPANATSAR